MLADLLQQKITTYSDEIRKADEELAKLRPRVQYLETMLYRLDGALTALQELQQGQGARMNHQAPVLEGT